MRDRDDNMGPWFPIGSYVRFLGKHGHQHERAEALQVFKVGGLYKVVDSNTYNSTSDVTLEGNPDMWNAVMFESVKKPAVKIERWLTTVEGNPYLPPEAQEMRLYGNLPNGHPQNAERKTVLTSGVQSVTGNVVETYNTLYILGEPNPEFVKFCQENGCYVPTKEVPIKS